MANYINGHVVSIDADFSQKREKDYKRLKHNHKPAAIGMDKNYLFMSREQLFKELNHK